MHGAASEGEPAPGELLTYARGLHTRTAWQYGGDMPWAKVAPMSGRISRAGHDLAAFTSARMAAGFASGSSTMGYPGIYTWLTPGLADTTPMQDNGNRHTESS